MSLLSLINVEFSIGGPLLLDRVNLTIERDERVALIGRNGAGKSTLLRLIDGEYAPDGGEVRKQTGLRIARVAQEVPEDVRGRVFDCIARGLGELGDLIRQYHAQAEKAFDADRLGDLQTKIEAAGGWDADRMIETVIEHLALDPDARFEALSGGMKRRVLLGQALVSQPDLLLLDEPTNHLDIESIDWLEEFLINYSGSLLFITHDRRFLRALATRIVEIDRGQLTSWPGDWSNYLRRREERLHAEELEHRHFDKKLAAEEVWIRQGIKARRTRNEGRVRALKKLREERAQRREAQGQVRMDVSTAGKSGKKVIEAENISFSYDGLPLIRDFSTIVFRGDRIGLIGPNGSGKSTLLKLLLGHLQPDSGEVTLGTNLEVVYFDQHRAALRDDWTAAENVSEGREFVEINGKHKHIIGYLADFLFTPDRARAPISKLSGGERNRLLLAKLFATPSNLLVMDEPTNDLDAETLELLESILADYPGTLLLVSHDRDFLDNVITASLVMEGDGRVGEYVGGYSDWKRQQARDVTPGGTSSGQRPEVDRPSKLAKAAAGKTKKLSYKLARELEQLPARVEQLDKRMAELSATMNDPGFYKESAETIAALNREVESVQTELDLAYRRWEELESVGGPDGST
ncbi:MAG: ATP-binding cassette domain-containing protein [Xanthomonadaceae bacterium]|nr:ATP-binding cassette domain-containing protein [Xanthomonadaceae bacterium]